MPVQRKWGAELLCPFIRNLVLWNPVNHSAVTLLNRNHFFVCRFVRDFVLKMKCFRGEKMHQFIVTMAFILFKGIPAGRKIQIKILKLIIWRRILACVSI